MNVKLAAQVLSHSVAVGMTTYCKVKLLSEEALHTAKFVKMMDNLFNAFNSSSKYSSVPYLNAITPSSNHLNFLEECKTYFSQLTTGSGKVVPCINGWLISIQSLKMLSNDLINENGFDYLCTRRLNQDCLENLFSIVRGKVGHRLTPTTQMQNNLGRLFVK